MKQDQAKIKIGKVDLDEDEFSSKNSKHRVTTFIDGDVLDWLKAEAAKQNLGYQTLLNLKLRNSMLGPTLKDEIKDAIEELFEDGKLVVKKRNGDTVHKGEAKPARKRRHG